VLQHEGIYRRTDVKLPQTDVYLKSQNDLVIIFINLIFQNLLGQFRKQSQLYEQRSAALVADSAFFGVLFFSLCWSVATNPLTPLSYAIGASLGTAYTYGLGKFVQTIGGDINNVEASESGVGNARFAFLILLFVILGKFRGPGGLQEIPTIAGFFTYQLASLKQGLEEYDD